MLALSLDQLPAIRHLYTEKLGMGLGMRLENGDPRYSTDEYTYSMQAKVQPYKCMHKDMQEYAIHVPSPLYHLTMSRAERK